MNNKLNLSIYDINYLNDFHESIFLPMLSDECLLSLNTFDAFLLDKTKSKYDFIEKLVYDLCKIQLINMGIDINSEDINIEFWFKTTGTYKIQMHTDSDDNSIEIRKISPSPLFTSLLYLNDNPNPTLLTNIDDESYKFKNFTNENSNLFLIFPKKMRNVVFNSGYFHREIKFFGKTAAEEPPRNALVINVWKKYCPLNLSVYESLKYEFYTFENNESVINSYKDTIIKKINVDDNLVLNDSFFTEILYRNNNDIFYNLKDLMENEYKTNDKFMLFNSINEPKINTKKITNIINITNKDHPIKKIKFSKNVIDFSTINITPNFINKEQLNYIKNCVIDNDYGVLKNDSVLFNYIKHNLFTKLYNLIVDTYKLNEEHNISIVDVIFTRNISNDNDYNTNNNSCIASIFINDDVIIKEEDCEENKEEININSKSIILKNNYKYYNNNNNADQILIEFLIDIW